MCATIRPPCLTSLTSVLLNLAVSSSTSLCTRLLRQNDSSAAGSAAGSAATCIPASSNNTNSESRSAATPSKHVTSVALDDRPQGAASAEGMSTALLRLPRMGVRRTNWAELYAAARKIDYNPGGQKGDFRRSKWTLVFGGRERAGQQASTVMHKAA